MSMSAATEQIMFDEMMRVRGRGKCSSHESNYTRLFGTPERAARTVMRYLYDGCDGVKCADGCPFYDVRYLTNCFLSSNTSAHELRVWLEGDAE